MQRRQCRPRQRNHQAEGEHENWGTVPWGDQAASVKSIKVQGKVFVEYAPLEKAWVPIEGNGYQYIY